MKKYNSISLRDGVLHNPNSLNFIRLLLALLVIVGHAWPLTHSGNSKFEVLSVVAVDLFFAISGFLIMASTRHGNWYSYLWRRFLRIFPGYWVSILVVVFIFAPLSFLINPEQGQWSIKDGVSYIIHNSTLINLQYGLGGSPNGEAWNGSAWTLWYEWTAYLGVLILAFVPGLKRYQRLVVTVAFAFSLTLTPIMELLDVTTNRYLHFGRLVPSFLAGACLYQWSDKIRVNKTLVISSVVFTGVIYWCFSGYARTPFQLVAAYAVLGMGVILKTSLCRKNDLSYGVYIYAFPVQMMLVLLGSSSLGVPLNILLCSAITVVFAYFSWVYVERPAMGLKNLVSGAVGKSVKAVKA